ncbi:MAG TPA: TRAP transporter substrate-binding protein [Syntrophorhabdaceae bacterium]|nr:TRAP transporter substrate-binding protein [Syntrophorhabdaceae bacterium]HQM82534.1 TRAP transporter substrate-binding protein [Syntrophorhabdaceae bacterium]
MKRCVVCSLFLVLSLSVLFVPSQAAAEKVITLRFAHYVTPTHGVSINLDRWAKEVEKRTNSRVKITIYPAGTLVPAPQIFDAINKGIADIGYAFISYSHGRFPLTEVIGMPLGYKSAIVATRMANEYLKKFKPKEFDSVQVMWLQAHGPGFVHTRKPVNKLEDIQGMKMRSTGVSSKIANALGATPVGMPMSEAYDSLSRGITEGIFCPLEALQSWKLGEVVSYSTLDFGASYSDCAYIAMNKNKWKSLPADIRQIIEKLNAEWIEEDGKMWDNVEKEAREFLLKRGHKIITLSTEENARWAKKVAPLLDEYVKNAKEKGLPGEEALKFCVDYLKVNQK